MSRYFGLLFARPSFLEGVARIFDLGGTLNTYNESESPTEADYLAIANDWRAIDDDMRNAIGSVMPASRLDGPLR